MTRRRIYRCGTSLANTTSSSFSCCRFSRFNSDAKVTLLLCTDTDLVSSSALQTPPFWMLVLLLPGRPTPTALLLKLTNHIATRNRQQATSRRPKIYISLERVNYNPLGYDTISYQNFFDATSVRHSVTVASGCRVYRSESASFRPFCILPLPLPHLLLLLLSLSLSLCAVTMAGSVLFIVSSF